VATKTLPALSHPDFHSVSDALFLRFVEDVSRTYERSLLGYCAFEYPESFPGACDGQPCCEKGTVHDLAGERELCAKHFAEVGRG
jgi:hypothetical protein